MGKESAIEWTDATWNPVTGCTKISAGCDNCYAERFSERFRGVPGHPFENGFDLTLRPDRFRRNGPSIQAVFRFSGNTFRNRRIRSPDRSHRPWRHQASHFERQKALTRQVTVLAKCSRSFRLIP